MARPEIYQRRKLHKRQARATSDREREYARALYFGWMITHPIRRLARQLTHWWNHELPPETRAALAALTAQVEMER